MAYQSCRWYDPYPRLAFALQLIALAPAEIRQRAWQSVIDMLLESLAYSTGFPDNTDPLLALWQQADIPEQAHALIRRYDASGSTASEQSAFHQAATALLLLKHAPLPLRSKATETLLAFLGENGYPASGSNT